MEQALDAVRDGSTDLDDQPASRLEGGPRLRDQAFDHFEPRGACENRVAGFEFADFELHVVGFGFADVGRVRYHEIESGGSEALQQIRLVEMNSVLELMAGSVGPGDFEGGGGNVRRVDFCLREFLGEGERDAA